MGVKKNDLTQQKKETLYALYHNFEKGKKLTMNELFTQYQAKFPDNKLNLRQIVYRLKTLDLTVKYVFIF